VPIGAVWASLPELVEAIDDAEWLAALKVDEVPPSKDSPMTRGADLETVVQFDPIPPSQEALQERLTHYPTAAGYTVPSPLGVPGVVTMNVDRLFGRVPVYWEAASFSERVQVLDRVAPAYRDFDDRWLRPGLGKRLELPAPFMSWWLLLFALSMIARYHPREWAALLRIERSDFAADLEFCLDAALEAVPRLVLDALTTGF